MHDPGRIDLSPLDPEGDPERWRRMMQATRLRMAAVLRDRERNADPLEVLSGWVRPILAAAAALLLLLGAADAMVDGPGPSPGSNARRLARLTEDAVLHGRAPTGAELLAAIRAEATP